MSEKKADGLPNGEGVKAPKGLSSSTGGRSLRQSLDLMKRVKGDRSPKKSKHRRNKSGVKQKGSPPPHEQSSRPSEQSTQNSTEQSSKKRLARTTSFHRAGKKDLEAENVMRAQSLEPSRAAKKLGRTKSFNQGMAKLDMVFGRSASKQRGAESEAPKVKVVGVSAPRGTTRMSETERLKFIRSLSSSTSMKVTKAQKERVIDHSIPKEREASLELKGIPRSKLGKNYVKRRVVAKSEWVAKDDAELTVKPGDVILIHSVDSAGWAEGSIVQEDESTTSEAAAPAPSEDTNDGETVESDGDKKENREELERGKGEEDDKVSHGTGAVQQDGEEGEGGPLQDTKGMSAPKWFPLKVMLPPGRLQNIPSGVSLMLNAEADGIPVVDDSSIVHEKEETEKALEKLLEQRPDKRDLEERHIVGEEETNPITRALEKKKIGDLLTGIFTSKKSKKKKSKSRPSSPRGSNDEDALTDVDEEEYEGGNRLEDMNASDEGETVDTETTERVEEKTESAPESNDASSTATEKQWKEKSVKEEEESAVEKEKKEEVEEEKASDTPEPSETTGEKEREPTPLAKGVDLFNENPTKGIKYFFDQNLSIVGNTPDSIARFLYKFTHFDRVQLGEFLGAKGELNEQILDAVLHQLDFSCLEFDMALRRFLYAFRLPGEAQKIDRLMLAFAKKYFEEQPGDAFADVDAIYILAFSVVMLNTDLHNPCIKRKMQVEHFVSQNRGVNAGGDFPPELLHDIYDMIMDDEIRDKTQDHFSDAIYRSWCGHCPGTGKRKYKRRWVVVDQSGFFILSNPNTKEPQHVFMYDQITYIKDLGTAKGEFRLKLKNQEEHYFCAKTPRHVKLWVAKVNLMRCRVGYLQVTQMEQQAMLHKAQAKAEEESTPGDGTASSASEETSTPASDS